MAMCPCTKFQSTWKTSIFETKFALKTLGQSIEQSQPENNLF